MSGVPKLLIIYAVAIPMAIVLGFLVSTPGMGSIVIIGLLLLLFLLPFLLKHHHFLLILFWNSAFNVFFLPAQPHFWLLLAFLSFGVAWLNNVMGEKNFIKVPEISRPLLVFTAVAFLTAFFRGGLGIRAFGGTSYGGKGYVYLLGAVVGYFALSASRVPLRKASRWTGWFFASGTSFGLSNLVYVLGPSFYLLYLLVPPEYAITEAQAEEGAYGITRLAGLPGACSALLCFLLARYGLRGVLDWRHPWRGLLFLAAFIASGFGGFRSVYVLSGLILLAQFYFERLYRTVFLPISIGLVVVGLVFVATFSSRLPLSLQRAVSFLPVKVDSSVASDAEGSLQWRLDMWKILLPDIPRYFFLGKGYRIDPQDLYLADLATQLGMGDASESARLSGDYHSGPFSVMLSFGIFGVLAFLWLLFAGAKCLYRNYHFGDPSLHHLNTFLLGYFLAHATFFLLFFGDIRADLFVFAGALGLSVSLNGGVAKAPTRATRIPAAQLVPQAA